MFPNAASCVSSLPVTKIPVFLAQRDAQMTETWRNDGPGERGRLAQEYYARCKVVAFARGCQCFRDEFSEPVRPWPELPAPQGRGRRASQARAGAADAGGLSSLPENVWARLLELTEGRPCQETVEALTRQAEADAAALVASNKIVMETDEGYNTLSFARLDDEGYRAVVAMWLPGQRAPTEVLGGSDVGLLDAAVRLDRATSEAIMAAVLSS